MDIKLLVENYDDADVIDVDSADASNIEVDFKKKTVVQENNKDKKGTVL